MYVDSEDASKGKASAEEDEGRCVSAAAAEVVEVREVKAGLGKVGPSWSSSVYSGETAKEGMWGGSCCCWWCCRPGGDATCCMARLMQECCRITGVDAG